MDSLNELVSRACVGDLCAYGRVVQATQKMVYAVARGILRDASLAEDAAQEAYLRAFRRLDELHDPSAFIVWLRRIVVTVALNMNRARRRTLLRLDDVPEVPILDEVETNWSQAQRQQLAGALLTLTPDERRLCERRYHGGWSTARLAHHAGIDETAIRKRLQRIRDKLRKEIEVAEQGSINEHEIPSELPDTITELLARPHLVELPENPVGQVVELLRSVYPDFVEVALPEIIDLSEARKTIGNEAMYLDPIELQRVDQVRILRYDLTLPLLMNVRLERTPLKIWAAGKAYRRCRIDATHLDAFHQAEVLWLDERFRLTPWQVTAMVLQSVDVLLPRRAVKIVPTQYAMCSQAWDLEIEDDGRWFEVAAWGVFSDTILRHLGGNPDRHTAIGVGYGLERLAMLRYEIDDIRKIEATLLR